MADIQNETEDKTQAVNNMVESVAEFDYAATLTEMPCNPAKENLLGRQDFQNGLIEYIKHAKTPFNIALQGEWGSGKTSLMNAISYKLCGYSITDKEVANSSSSAPFYSIWINTWQFAISTVASQAVIGILQSIVNQIGQLLPKEKSNVHITNFKKILAGVAVGGSKMLFKIADKASCGVLSDLGVEGEDIADMVKGVQESFSDKDNTDKDNSDSVVQAFSVIDRLKVEIRELIDEVLTRNDQIGSNTTWDVDQCRSCDGADCEYKNGLKKGFIFFIDDLDRIEPSLAVDILETLKNIFDLESCIFVFAVDYNTIVKGLKLKLSRYNSPNSDNRDKQNIDIYADDVNWLECHKSIVDYMNKRIHNDENREYELFFDKIFQVSVSLPVSFYNVKLLLKQTLEDVSYFHKDELTENDLVQLERIVQLSIGRNPRHIKKIVNAISLIDAFMRPWYLGLGNGNKLNRPGLLGGEGKKVIFALLCLKSAYSDIYELMITLGRPYYNWNKELADQFNAPSFNVTNLASSLMREQTPYKIDLRDHENDWVVPMLRICYLNDYLRANSLNIVMIFKKLDITFRALAARRIEILNKETKGQQVRDKYCDYKTIALETILSFYKAAACVGVTLS